MIQKLIILALLLMTTRTSFGKPVIQSVIAPNPDLPSLPPLGRSIFDYLFSKGQNGKVVVPFPFDKLINKIKKSFPNNSKDPLSVAFIPFGRSLQRFAAEPNFFKYPRIILATHQQNSRTMRSIDLDLQSKLYIAYVEPSNMLEVISYNKAAARFEFQVVKDYYKGGQPKVYYARRSLCQTCHEGQVPIFPSEPWSETNDNQVIADNIIKARGAKTYFGQEINLQDMPGRGFSKEVMKIDFDILESTHLQIAAILREKICLGDLQVLIDCRKLALKVAFANHFNYWPQPEWQLLKRYKKIMDEFYRKYTHINLPVSFLPDRDPIDNSDVFGLSHKPVIKKLPFKSMHKNIQHLKKLITNLPPKQDPKKPRLQKRKLYPHHCYIPLQDKPTPFKKWCYTKYFLRLFTAGELKFIGSLFSDNRNGKKQFNFDKFSTAVDAMAKNPSALTAKHLVSDQILKELIEIANPKLKSKVKTCCQPISDPPKLIPEGIATNSIFDKGIKEFFQYCGSCHRDGGIDYPTQFLFGNSEVEVKGKLIKYRQLILNSLMSRSSPMPPLNSQPATAMNSEKRAQLIKFIKNLKIQ